MTRTHRTVWLAGIPGCLLVVVAAGIVAAGSVDVPHRFVPGETADARAVNENFETHAAAITDNDARIGALEERAVTLRGRSTDAREIDLTRDGGPPSATNTIPLQNGGVYQVITDIVAAADNDDGFPRMVAQQMTYVQVDPDGVSTGAALPDPHVLVGTDWFFTISTAFTSQGAALLVVAAGEDDLTVDWTARVRLLPLLR